MKAIIMTNSIENANRVFTNEIKSKLSQNYELCVAIINKKNIDNYLAFAKETECIFTTWGMETFTKKEIAEFFPKATHIFYAAGSVQHFAKEFLESGIKVYSAWRANAIPVAEYTYAQIILATKGFYRAERNSRCFFYPSFRYANACGGNYHAKIGILGVGGIGSIVAQKLQANDLSVLYYDPFLPSEKAKELGITKATLSEIFSTCDVITNHLANNKETVGILSAELFASMKRYATFINTGRGMQVDEKGLATAMRKVKTRTALLDVTKKEPYPPLGRLARRKNIIVTPHIAGSLGNEVVRMAQYMIDESERIANGEAPLYEVTVDMLATMA